MNITDILEVKANPNIPGSRSGRYGESQTKGG